MISASGRRGWAATSRGGAHSSRVPWPERPASRCRASARRAFAAPVGAAPLRRLAVQPADRRRERRHLQEALRRERRVRAGSRRVSRRRRDQADRRPAHRHDVFGGGPSGPLAERRLGARRRRPARPRRHQGQHVRGQRPATCRCRTASSAACPTIPASTRSSTTRSISTRPRSQPPATWDELLDQCRKLKKDEHRRVPLCQRLAAPVGEPLLEPLLDLVLGRRQGLRREERPRLRRRASRKVLEMHRKTVYAGGPRPARHLHPRPGGRAELRHRPRTPTWSLHDYDQKVLNDPKLSQIAGAGQERHHAGRHALDLHLDRALSDGRPADRRRPHLEPDAVLRRQGQGRPVSRHPALGARVRPRHALQGGHRDPEVQAAFSKWKDLEGLRRSSRRPRRRATSPRRCGSPNGTGT